MKTKAIEIGTEMIDATTATDAWEALKKGCSGGKEPKENGLKLLDVDDLKAAGVPPMLARAWATLFAGNRPVKTSKFKPGRPYTATEYATFYERDPKNGDLLSDISRATDGKRWVMVPAGKYNAEQSARYIQIHMDQDEPPVAIDGVEPVFPGQETEPKEDDEDPSAQGHRLPVDGISKVTGANFTGVELETRQAYAHAMGHDLRDASTLEKRTAALAAVGKSASEWLRGYPDAARSWAKTKPTQRPTLKIARRPFAEPIAAKTGARGGHEAPVVATGADALRAISSAAISARLSREALVSGTGMAHSLRVSGTPAEQMWMDVCELSRIGGAPWKSWLETAAHLADPRREAQVFLAALAGLSPAVAWMDAAHSTAAPSAAPLVYVITGGHKSWNGMQEHLAPMIRAGMLRMESDAGALPGENVRVRQSRMLAEAAVVVVLVFAGMPDEADSAIASACAAGKKVVPVLVGACLPYGALAGRTMLPRNGRPYSGDEDGVAIATELRAIVSRIGA